MERIVKTTIQDLYDANIKESIHRIINRHIDSAMEEIREALQNNSLNVAQALAKNFTVESTPEQIIIKIPTEAKSA